MGEIKIVVGDDKKRAQECLKEILAVADRYDCVIMPNLIISSTGKIKGGIEVYPKKRNGG